MRKNKNKTKHETLTHKSDQIYLVRNNITARDSKLHKPPRAVPAKITPKEPASFDVSTTVYK